MKAGINTSVFKSHSTRAAATSAAHLANVNVELIMKAAGWTNVSTFAKFYKKPIQENTWADAILS